MNRRKYDKFQKALNKEEKQHKERISTIYYLHTQEQTDMLEYVNEMEEYLDFHEGARLRWFNFMCVVYYPHSTIADVQQAAFMAGFEMNIKMVKNENTKTD